MNYTVYTDGASPKTGAAWAFIVYDENGGEVYRSSQKVEGATNNQVELLAISMAAQWVTGQRDFESALIVSDSQYSLGIIDESREWKPKKNVDLVNSIRAQLRSYLSSGKIKLRHVKGHSTDKRNIAVDRLAVEAAK